MTAITYIDPARLPYPFCPGCSHGTVLDRLNEAMLRLSLDPQRVVMVTDIGCVGLSDQWFVTHAFHGLHGRSVLYAEGIKLAAPDLEVIVLMGDGAAGIGGHHLISAARRNIGVHVVLFNNFNFGMTGGEHSVTTPQEARTSTTRSGQMEQPFRIAETLSINGAPFAARRAAYDGDLVDVMQEALAFDGFSIIEVLEFCPSYYVPCNQFRKSDMEALLAGDVFPRMLEVRDERTEYATYLAAVGTDKPRRELLHGDRIEKRFEHTLSDKLDIIVAGAAGGKVLSSASLFARAGIASGLFALQHDDYPVTVRTGHSISFLKLSPSPIAQMGIEAPGILLLLSEEGLVRAGTFLKKMQQNQRVILAGDLPRPETAAAVERLKLDQLKGRMPRQQTALGVLFLFLKKHPLFPLEALRESVARAQGTERAEKLFAIAREASDDIWESA